MVTAIQALARALGKTTVAEGVETIEQLRALQDIECDHIQGFLTGRPVSLSEMLDQQAAETGTNHQVFATPGPRRPISATVNPPGESGDSKLIDRNDATHRY